MGIVSPRGLSRMRDSIGDSVNGAGDLFANPFEDLFKRTVCMFGERTGNTYENEFISSTLR